MASKPWKIGQMLCQTKAGLEKGVAYATLTLRTNPSGGYQLNEFRNVMGRCLDVAGGVNANRTNVQIFDCNRTKSPQWTQ
jgi:hypothetical protein